MEIKKSFASDNNSGVHPEIIESMIKANSGHVVAYGDDCYTEQAKDIIRHHFGQDIDVYFVFNGTGANVLSFQSIIRSFNSIICAETAHINVDECGAPERNSGCKLLSVPTKNGKLTIELIKQHLHGFGFEHHSQPKIITITQVTEVGTVYTFEEIKAITDFAHEKGLYVHMDGARLSNAVVSLGTDFETITRKAGIDVLSFGLTKNGAMNAEAVIFFDPELSKDCKYYRKQSMQLGSKMRFVSCQFTAMLKKDLWKKSASQANQMAQLLKDKVSKIPEITITQKVEANGIFAIIPEKIIEPLKEEYFYYMWDHTRNEVRWMTSFDTTEQDINLFVDIIRKLLK